MTTPEQDSFAKITSDLQKTIKEAYSRGYKDATTYLTNKQAARDRNGGTEPDYHNCHFCGEYVANGYTSKNERHWLSDCRPDLVQHEPGETCTWWNLTFADGSTKEPNCYAFQDRDTQQWGDEHKHFYPDGAM